MIFYQKFCIFAFFNKSVNFDKKHIIEPSTIKNTKSINLLICNFTENGAKVEKFFKLKIK
jgi:hypothetical protein